ncbi:tRNA(fMet)-specific endonuclease VapC [Aquisphaera giovannonii]|uniref:Ribonuclease VapC n=1 Tax=Aquisphaera giovannonii TaxID=406548 RepID=A0A5B9W8V0_9BACT|nr:type II toxin-antitoxin system VapC family toxin [Aquisphaera giovannonii]QEH36350.1 tRNA(fMet)-specific endonuclease VapC [Aquisphaera giovannonii]
MRRYLLDTNAVGDWINRRHGVDLRVREARGRGAVIGTCEPVVAELFFGVENSETRDENAERLQRALAGLKCWPLTRGASREFGRIMAMLKRSGTMIGPMDVLIAAIARTLQDCVVVSRDADLLHIPGLAVENWTAP